MRTLVAAVAGISLVAVACGSDSDQSTEDTAQETEATEPATTAAESVDEGSPERVVSLSPSATEMMFAIGADDVLVAVDSNSNYPAGALELPNELVAFEPSVESIVEFEPDLVLIGGDFTGLGDQLTELDIEFLDLPPATSLSDSYSQIELLGATTGNVGEAAEVVSEMETRIDEIVAASGDAGAGLSFYHEIDDQYFSADSSTFIGEIYSLLGLVNVADGDESESFGFPQLNAEFIIDANPDLIFLPTGTFYMATPDDVASRPGWDAIAAVQNDAIIVTDDEIAGRWGPRVVDYLDSVATAVQSIVE
jgi:iron complex transport system substrate-binding protein